MFTLEQLKRAEMSNYQLHLQIERKGFTLYVKIKGLAPTPILTSRSEPRVFKSLDALYTALDGLESLPAKITIK